MVVAALDGTGVGSLTMLHRRSSPEWRLPYSWFDAPEDGPVRESNWKRSVG
jgi:hypothetical protein